MAYCLDKDDKRAFYIFLAAILAAMMVNVAHPYLWGPDEPREAETAREALVTRNFVTPHLCGLPFLEKPPLYYDMIAAVFAITGSITPTAARSVSAALGLLMLASVFFFALRWKGMRGAIFSTAILAAMPQFYRYSHWILLDIGVGAFSVLALTALAYWMFWAKGKRGEILALFIFYLGSACAFLTKGVVGLFHAAVVALAFFVVTKRYKAIKRLLSSPMIFVFLAPVGLWIYLYYKEGGICYLHEHFVNNIIGRFLHVHFKLNGCDLYNTDLGNKAKWYFYLQRLPDMFGLTLLALPFALWDWARRFFNAEEPDEKRPDEKRVDGSITLFLVIWAILPIVLLSIPIIKEVSYVLPSYAAVALLAGGWLDGKLKTAQGKKWDGVAWLFIVIFVVASKLLHHFLMGFKAYLLCMAVFFLVTIFFMIRALLKKRLTELSFLIISVSLAAVIAGNIPKVILKTRPCLKHKSYIGLAYMVWAEAGNRRLYLYMPNDTWRGSIPFYGKRMAEELDRPLDLCSVLLEHGNAIMLDRDRLNMATIEPCLIASGAPYRLIMLPDMGLDAEFALLISGGHGVWTAP